MDVLFAGDVSAVRAWGRAQARHGISCREVLRDGSPTKVRAFAEATLEVVHHAVAAITAAYPVTPLQVVYLTKYLHDAVTATAVSPWAEVDDDCRGAVALEIAQRCRTATFLGGPWKPLTPPRAKGEGTDRGGRLVPHLLVFLEGVVLEDLAMEPLHDEYLSKVKRLQTGFGLSTEELSSLLRVSRTAIHKWTRGSGISRDLQARIDEWLAVLMRMESYWRAGRLPSIMRRHGRGLNGKTPLDLVLHGKTDRVLKYFDALTDYSGTA